MLSFLNRKSQQLKFFLKYTLAGIRFQRKHQGELQTVCALFGYPGTSNDVYGMWLNQHANALTMKAECITPPGREHVDYAELYAIAFWSQKRLGSFPGEEASSSNTIQNNKIKVLIDLYDQQWIMLRHMYLFPQDLLTWLESFHLPVSVKAIQIINNPFDFLNSDQPGAQQHDPAYMDNLIEGYFRVLCENIEHISAKHPDSFLLLQEQDIQNDPVGALKQGLDFLQLDCTREYLNTCAKLVPKPDVRIRDRYPWTPQQISRVEELMQKYSFLQTYHFQ